MSLRKHSDAKLKGWRGPRFPEGLVDLARAFDANSSMTDLYLRDVATRVMGFVPDAKAPKWITRDGYEWYCGLEFQVIGGRFLVLFPWKRDPQKGDGSQLDRLPAVYLKGFAVLSEVHIALNKLIRFLK